jgi:hypothetical protein
VLGNSELPPASQDHKSEGLCGSSPPRFEPVINPETAKTLGLSVPPGLIAIADEAIEYGAAVVRHHPPGAGKRGEPYFHVALCHQILDDGTIRNVPG